MEKSFKKRKTFDDYINELRNMLMQWALEDLGIIKKKQKKKPCYDTRCHPEGH